jgi:hypothetical protein
MQLEWVSDSMAIALSDTTWCDLWDESRQQAQPLDSQDESDRLIACPLLFGRGYK